MKKSLSVAAGIVAFASCLPVPQARAQGSVTVYGIVDTGVEYLNHANAAGQGKFRTLALTGLQPSRLGFRGVEDLGGGLRAFFNLETGFAATTGALSQGNRIFGRQANLGLADTAWGTLTLGRQYNMTALSMVSADVMGPSNHGVSNMDSYLPNTRSDNAVGYLNKFGNTAVGFTYSTGRDTSSAGGPAATNCPGEVAGDAQACRQWTAMIKYDASRWGVAAGYDTMRGGPGAANLLTSSDYKDNRANYSGWFMLGQLKIGGGLVARHQQRAVSINSNLWYLGASYPLSVQWQLEGQVAHLDTRNSPDDSTLGTVRAIYFLSRRTSVYGSYAYIRNRGNAAVPVSSGITAAAGQNQASVMAGLRHTF